ncbi:PP-loop family-domain-containing protein [Aspergillus avenaceus]|uniref:tRNA(Ile)-lysidine synthetase n=1 Tax=Aspergillus avenaceus TaxID=36643 RepID=A0A5N6TSJ7_ASPAV|nr:PP-loop family-domain-containing protein [Aspergillus avenaceus]
MAEPSLRASTKAITASQSLESFHKLWTTSRPSQRPPRRLGLAVSGGADSMALAYLSKNWERSRPNEISITAFVVDHKAREESTREANTVAKWLGDMVGLNEDIKTEILPLTWPETADKVSAFETHARRLRFQALGRACRDRDIEALLMGHHLDDNVETTLWRLCTGASGAGLAGIPGVTKIPECHGIYGVSESGSTYTLLPKKDTKESNNTKESKQTNTTEQKEKKKSISTGGILICRPLLPYPKANLLATCHENNIPYVSDPTNFDPTLTPRNAIRSLLSSDKLPQALRTPSILSLIKSSQSLLQDSTSLSNTLLTQTKLHSFFPETGTLMLRFPSHHINLLDKRTPLKNTKPSKNPARRTHQIQSLTLRRITELLSPFPENHFPLRSFEDFVPRVFSHPHSDNGTGKRHPFTLGGVMFKPDSEDKNTWFLSRQPFMRGRLPISQFEVPFPAPGRSTEYSSWSLWDNRFWFRLGVSMDQNLGYTAGKLNREGNTLSLLLRPFQPSDLQLIRDIHGKSGSGNKADFQAQLAVFQDQLKRQVPGQTRFTLPLLVAQSSSQNMNHELPLALPTLHMWLPGMREYLKLPTSGRLHWEWMYKMIDKDALRSMGWL